MQANYAVEHGIPWSEFLRRWSWEDRSIVVAVQLERAAHCTSCGLTEKQWHDDPGAFVPMQVVCPWCALKDRVRSDGDTSASIPGASIKMLPRNTAEKISSTKAQRPMSPRERARKQ